LKVYHKSNDYQRSSLVNLLFKKTCIALLGSVLVLPSCVTKNKPSDAMGNTSPPPAYIQLARKDADTIGKRIWMNESSGKREGLTVWNQGESFASLGIGHFIWYPQGQEGPFHETFPDLLSFIKKQGIILPRWLEQTADCPWQTRESFLANFNTAELLELRAFLEATIPQQVEFMIRRLELTLPAMLTTLPASQRPHIERQFHRIAQIPQGVYALVDYVNFKGEGTNPNERYQGQGWGLLQVLQQMAGNTQNPLQEFAAAAEFVLKRRIYNSPPERGESRWFTGWQNRVYTYLSL
jgi:hypothetical protein